MYLFIHITIYVYIIKSIYIYIYINMCVYLIVLMHTYIHMCIVDMSVWILCSFLRWIAGYISWQFPTKHGNGRFALCEGKSHIYIYSEFQMFCFFILRYSHNFTYRYSYCHSDIFRYPYMFDGFLSWSLVMFHDF